MNSLLISKWHNLNHFQLVSIPKFSLIMQIPRFCLTQKNSKNAVINHSKQRHFQSNPSRNPHLSVFTAFPRFDVWCTLYQTTLLLTSQKSLKIYVLCVEMKSFSSLIEHSWCLLRKVRVWDSFGLDSWGAKLFANSINNNKNESLWSSFPPLSAVVDW